TGHQRSVGGPLDRSVRGLPDRRGAAENRHATRTRHHFASPRRGAAGCSHHNGTWLEGLRGRNLVWAGCAGEDTARFAFPALRLGRGRNQLAGYEAEARATRPLSRWGLRLRVRRAAAQTSRRLRTRHPGLAHQGGIALKQNYAPTFSPSHSIAACTPAV